MAEVILAEWVGEPIGFALFFHNFSTFLDAGQASISRTFSSITEHRGKGIGRALLSRLARIATERGCGRLEWAVLDWNQPSIDFYKSLGAVPKDEWTIFRLTGEALNGWRPNRPGTSSPHSPQLGVFRPRLFQDRDVGVRVLPEPKKILVGSPCLALVSRESERSC